MTCHASDMIALPTRLTLIDVHNGCLTTVSMPAKYASLSYVWGTSDSTLQTTKANKDQLHTKDSLRSQVYGMLLPATIKDAMHVTAGIGVPYLWVDRLCIVQDDVESKSIHIQAMGSIYHHAYVTIIAGDGIDANHGIRGVGGGSKPRDPSFLTSRRLDFSPACKMATVELSLWPMERYERHENGFHYWNQRAWTFQERILSRRNIIFTRGTVVWECLGHYWYEEFSMEPENTVTLKTPSRKIPPPFSPELWPDLKAYTQLVSEYSGRSLTYEEDALDAFTAILNCLSVKFDDGFIFGLPEAFFDLALLWRGSGAMQRRTVSDSQHPGHKFPSWSWVGWRGGLSGDWIGPYSDQYVWQWTTVCPLFDWFIINRTTGRLRRISNSYHHYRQAGESKDILPQAWSKTRVPENSVPDRVVHDQPLLSDFYFSHASIPEKSFTFPVPIRSRPFTPEYATWGPLLSFRAASCQVASQSSGPHYVALLEERFHFIRTPDDSVVGIIYPTESTELKCLFCGSCKLIAISQGTMWSSKGARAWKGYQPIEMQLHPHLNVSGQYEFYNVLWIGWENEIAYRKGVGRIWKPFWNEQDLVEIDVVLG